MRFNGKSRDKFEKEFVNLYNIRSRVIGKLGLVQSTEPLSRLESDPYSSKHGYKLTPHTKITSAQIRLSPIELKESIHMMDEPNGLGIRFCEMASWLESNLQSQFAVSSLVFSIAAVLLVSYLVRAFIKNRKKQSPAVEQAEDRDVSECIHHIDSALIAMQEVNDKMNNFQELFRCLSSVSQSNLHSRKAAEEMEIHSKQLNHVLPPAYVTNKEFPNNHMNAYAKDPG